MSESHPQTYKRVRHHPDGVVEVFEVPIPAPPISEDAVEESPSTEEDEE